MELVSVIIPVHNAEAYIAETLLALKQQTYPAIEAIVVNGGSTDSSIAIAEQINLPNLKIFNRENLGQASNSNFGISKASGRLIKFLDADDILAADCIEKMVEKWQENPSRLVFGEWHHFVENIKHVSWNNNEIYKDYDNALDWYVDNYYLTGGMLAAWMWLIPKQLILKAGGWDERLTITNDLEFSTRLVLHSDGIGFAKEAKHYYRKGSANAMTGVMKLGLPDATAKSVVTGLNSAREVMLKAENSPRMRLVYANLYQKWIFLFYPKHKDHVKEFEAQVKKLGGSNISPKGGRLYNLLLVFLPWKLVTKLQFFLHSTIWTPILKRKQHNKFKKQFGV
ncbi:MAG: glycosyltransferase family 2 protein [Bacteroidota bacterium]